MRARCVVLLLAGSLVATPAALLASESGPVIVVPGKAGVPVIMYGHDVSGAVIEGDWGLHRPGHIDPTIIYRYRPGFGPAAAGGGYYPRTGRAPGYGRKEADAPRPAAPAEPFTRSWSSQSDPGPVTTYPPYTPPPVILAPGGHPGRGPGP